MARGVTIGEVTNILDSQDMNGTEKLPVSSGNIEPQVVTTGELKEYITEGIEVDREFTRKEMDDILNNY